MFCPKCGTQNPDGAKFCGGCGQEMVVPAQAAAAQVAPQAVAQPVQQAAQAIPGAAQAIPGAAQAAPAYAIPMSQASTYATPMNSGTVTVAGKTFPRKNLIVGAIIIAVVALLIVVGISVSSCSKSGFNSADEAASALDEPFSTAMSDLMFGKGTDSLKTFGNKVLDGVHPKLLSAALEEAGYSDRDTAVNELMSTINDAYSSAQSTLSVMSAFDDMIKLKGTYALGDSLSSSELDDIKEACEKAGVTDDVSAGYELDMSMSLEALQDIDVGVASMSKGESETISKATYSSLQVVKIGDKWYYWPESSFWD